MYATNSDEGGKLSHYEGDATYEGLMSLKKIHGVRH